MNLAFQSVRARAPLRLGLAGGGTDLSPFSDEYGGVVLNCTIDRYAFAFLTPRDDGKLVFRSKDLGLEESFDTPESCSDSKLLLHAGVYCRIMTEFNGGKMIPMTVTTSVDTPMGSGLGTSSALVVALVEVFRRLLDLPLGRYDVAHLAYEIERLDLGLSGGKQDQYSAAFGSINFIEFLANDRVVVNPLRLPDWIVNEVESSMVTVFSGQSRASADIIDQQTAAMVSHEKKALDAMFELKSDAIDMKLKLLRGDIQGMADVLRKSWESKKATAKRVSNARIEELFELALAKGAMSGKVSGAGGGGFLMFMVAPENRHDLIEALRAEGADANPVSFTHAGCESWQTKF
ncbi:MAG: dehydrogenase [Sphingomonas sp.]|uniref:GHMP family kinase ATP-binding protein n=1 Tax=Sphingomonas sp. TaxID=28214 RepID=UPI0035A99AA2|nr:dehydrogenase [Sphingomonas sp.]